MADVEELTAEQKAPAITVRALGQKAAPAKPLESYFSDLPNPSEATPKQGQKPLVDYFKDVSPADTQNQVVKPPSMKGVDIFAPEKDADYETGAPMGIRWNLYRGSSNVPENGKSEQEIYLEKEFGKGNYKKDNSGTWLVKPNWNMNEDATYEGPRDKPNYHDQKTAPWMAVFPRGARGTVENIGVGAAATVPTLVGGLLGAIGGQSMAGGHPMGGVAGAFAGSGYGHVADEGLKALQGFYNKSPLELAGDTAIEGGVNALFQGAGPAWNASKNSLYNTTSQTLQRWTGVTPETRALTQSLEPYGVTPPVRSIAPRVKSLEYDRRNRNMTSGDPRAAERQAVVDELIGETFDRTGFSPQQRARGISYVNDVNAGNDPGQTGQIIRDAVTARNTQSQLLQDAHLEDANRSVARAVETITRNINAPPKGKAKVDAVTAAGQPARELTETMEDTRATWGHHMSVAAKDFHNSANGAPIVNISATVPLVEDFLHPVPGPMRNILSRAEGREAPMSPADLPDNVAPTVAVDDIKAIMEAIANRVRGGVPENAGMAPAANDNPIMVTIEEAHKLRSSLMEMVRLRGDTDPIGMRRGEVYKIVGAIDAAMDQTGLEAGGTVGAGLRRFNQEWAEGIVRFTNNDINHIMRETKAGRPPDAGVVADAIMNRRSLAATKQIYDMLSDDLKFAVQTADLQNVLRDAAVPVGAFGRPTIDPDAILEALAERAKIHQYMYGAKSPMVKALEDLAVTMKAVGGKVDIDSLPRFHGNVVPFGRSPVGTTREIFNIVESLHAARAEQLALRREVENDGLAALRSTDPQLHDMGVLYFLQSEARTIRAAELLGATSPEWETLRREAKLYLLRKAIVKTPTGLGRTVNARALDEGLSGLTTRQQQMFLPGHEYDDFRLLANQARMLFPELAEKADAGTSFAVASTLGNLPKLNALRRWTWSQVAGYIADSPQVARLLAGSIRQDPYRGRRLLSYMMQTGVDASLANARQSGTGAAPAGGPEPSFDDKMKALQSVHAPTPKKTGYQGPAVE